MKLQRYTSVFLTIGLPGVLSFQPDTGTSLYSKNLVEQGVLSAADLRWAKLPSSRKAASCVILQSSRTDESPLPQKVDSEALVKYCVSLVTQMTLLFGLLSALDSAVAYSNFDVPFAINVAFFYVLALKSRVFNPLLNSRPNPANLEVAESDEVSTPTEPVQRVMPKWTPPGFIFPIVWLLLIGPLRAYTSTLVLEANGGTYADISILSLMLHLSIGDIWNTINNVEKRYGASVIGVLCVWLSAANASYQYSQVSTTAGELLGLSLIWLTIASGLIIQTWRLNPNPMTGELDPLFPVVDDSTKTKLIWFEK